jgi:MFS family permease
VIDTTGWQGFVGMAILGGTSYPLYSIAGAYTNDWVPADTLAAVASQLVLLYGAGALSGPFLTSLVMGWLGDDGYLWSLLAIHAALGVFFAIRIAVSREPFRDKPWNEVALAARVFYLPATAVGMGRRIRANRLTRVRLPGMDPIDDEPPTREP